MGKRLRATSCTTWTLRRHNVLSQLVSDTQRGITGSCIACLVMDFAASREIIQVRCVEVCGVDAGRDLVGSEGTVGKVQSSPKQKHPVIGKDRALKLSPSMEPLLVCVMNASKMCRRLPPRSRTTDLFAGMRLLLSDLLLTPLEGRGPHSHLEHQHYE